MKNKLEQKLDVELKEKGVMPEIYHFTKDIDPFTAITIVDERFLWRNLRGLIHAISSFLPLETTRSAPATMFIEALHAKDVYGVAICDHCDQFNRQRGRIIAKGRLLKYLKEMAK
jgi:hypothetical protein